MICPATQLTSMVTQGVPLAQLLVTFRQNMHLLTLRNCVRPILLGRTDARILRQNHSAPPSLR